jgi:hypothetical protein
MFRLRHATMHFGQHASWRDIRDRGAQLVEPSGHDIAIALHHSVETLSTVAEGFPAEENWRGGPGLMRLDTSTACRGCSSLRRGSPICAG